MNYITNYKDIDMTKFAFSFNSQDTLEIQDLVGNIQLNFTVSYQFPLKSDSSNRYYPFTHALIDILLFMLNAQK